MRRCEAKRPVLAVRVSCEANRLGGQLLADAFERLERFASQSGAG